SRGVSVYRFHFRRVRSAHQLRCKVSYRWGANIPAVFPGPCGSGVRSGPFHSINAEAFFLNTAGLKVVEPATAYDAKGLIKAAIRDPDPVLYFEHKKLYRLPRLREELP